MLQTDEILSTVHMLQSQHLDVRTVTMGIDLNDCAGPDIDAVCRKIEHRITTQAARLVETCDRVGGRYTIPVVNKRLAVSPVSILLEGHGTGAALAIARAIDAAASRVNIDLVGGFSALVERGVTPGQKQLIDSLPEVLNETRRVCSSIQVASTKAGINMDAVAWMGRIIKAIAERSPENLGFGAAKLVVFSNIPSDNPFMAGAYLGAGQGSCVINIGVSGPGVVTAAVREAREAGTSRINEFAEVIKRTAFKVTRVGELIGREVAAELGVPFGIVDLSLAPTPAVGDSVGEIFEALGIDAVGGPGTTAAVAMVNDAVKKGGLFASSSVGGLSGAFIPVSEDSHLAAAARVGTLSLEKLEALTCVCSVGLDMILIPGNTSATTLGGIIADEMAIGMVNNKTTGVRIIPVPGKNVGDEVDFGGLFGGGPVMEVRNDRANQSFIEGGGHIPAPIRSLTN